MPIFIIWFLFMCIFLENVKRVHPYQRRRTSITGLVL
jgi:hypothetical protein